MTDESRAPIYQLRGITRSYRQGDTEAWALRGVDLTVERGEYLVLRGPSGCGKSTLLAIMGLLDAPTAGTLEIAGEPAHALDAEARAALRGLRIGFVFQQFNLIPYFTVARNVELPLAFHRRLSNSERADRVADALSKVGMQDYLKRTPDQLSGGQQQRVAIARALVGAPDIILADEPTGNLDSANGDQLMELLAAAHAAGTTVCLVTHDPRYEAVGSRALHLRDGCVVE